MQPMRDRSRLGIVPSAANLITLALAAAVLSSFVPVVALAANPIRSSVAFGPSTPPMYAPGAERPRDPNKRWGPAAASTRHLSRIPPVVSSSLAQGSNWLGTNCISSGGGCGSSPTVPADPGIAVGSSDLIETTNVSIAVYNKAGGFIANTNWQQWFGVPTSHRFTDPDVVWDFLSLFYVFTVIDESANVLYYAGSEASTATSGWCVGSISQPASAGSYDYAKIGTDSQSIYVTYNLVDSNGHYLPSNLLFVTKNLEGNTFCTGINTNGVNGLTNTDGTAAISIWPANEKVQASEGFGAAMYLLDSHVVQAANSWRDDINLFVAHNVALAREVNMVTTGDKYEGPVDVPQLNGSSFLTLKNPQLTGAFLNDDTTIFIALTSLYDYGGGNLKDSPWWARINPGSSAFMWSTRFYDPGSYLFHPGISAFANATGKGGVITFTKCTGSQYEQLLVQQFNSDGSLNGPVLVPFSASQAYLAQPTRWGDFATSAIDPNGPAIYSVDEVEYQDSYNWSTWITVNQ